MRRCSALSRTSARFCRAEKTTTIPSDRTAVSAISRRRLTPTAALPKGNGTGRCATPRAPRPVPLLHRSKWAQINLGLCSSLDERRRSSGQSARPSEGRALTSRGGNMQGQVTQLPSGLRLRRQGPCFRPTHVSSKRQQQGGIVEKH